VSSFENNTMLR